MKEILYPHGGGFIKNTLASLMLSRSSVGSETEINKKLINSRVPPRDGLVVGEKDEHYNDSFVFQGSDKEGRLFMTRLGFRSDGSICDTWLWMRLNNKKFVSPVTTVEGTSKDKIKAADITYTPLEEGCWKISYKGPLDNGISSCEVDLTYTPATRMYSFGVHADKKTYALALAEMPWSREYFKTLKSEKAERIEQGGILKGTVNMDGEIHNLDLLAFRDHSWGKRDWNNIRRYIWNLFAMESPLKINGRDYTHICFTTVHYISFNHLVSGWIAGPDSILPITASSDMHKLGAEGSAPEEFTVIFRPKNSPEFKVKVTRDNKTEHPWMMQNDLFEVNEAYCSFSINGIKGCGMSEFGYTREK